MGTNGASGLKMHLLGSFTSGMIQASSVPVIAVPDEASMLEPKHIVYATDLDNVDNELQELLQFAAFFDAHIQVLHFEKAENKILHREKLLASLKKTSAYTNLSLSAVPSDDIEECISCFLAEENANMLAMFSNHRNFFARLFRSSYTTDMACSIEIPLFAGKK